VWWSETREEGKGGRRGKGSLLHGSVCLIISCDLRCLRSSFRGGRARTGQDLPQEVAYFAVTQVGAGTEQPHLLGTVCLPSGDFRLTVVPISIAGSAFQVGMRRTHASLRPCSGQEGEEVKNGISVSYIIGIPVWTVRTMQPTYRGQVLTGSPAVATLSAIGCLVPARVAFPLPAHATIVPFSC